MVEKPIVRMETKDQPRAFELFENLLYFFPYDSTKCHENKGDRNSSFEKPERLSIFVNGKLIHELEHSGYTHRVQFGELILSPLFTPLFECYQRVHDLCGGLFHNGLAEIERSPRDNSEFFENNGFQFVKLILKFLFDLLLPKDCEQWPRFLYLGSQQRDPRNEFSQSFGIEAPPHLNYSFVLTAEEFTTRINKILNLYFGTPIISLCADGILRYMGMTVQSHQTQIAIDFLFRRKMTTVIKGIDEIRKYLDTSDNEAAMWRCRKGAETFLKDLLHTHNITDLVTQRKKGSTIQIDDGTLQELVQTVRRDISQIFVFPQYSKNMEVGFRELFVAAGSIVGGLTDNNVHGKGTPNLKPTPGASQPTKEEVEAAFNFLVLLINTTLPFEKH